MLLVCNTLAAQTFPCTGDFFFTRQITPSPNTYISNVIISGGDIAITNPGTLSPAVDGNASVQYNGYIWTQKWSAASFTLLRVAANYTTTAFTVAGMPTTNLNNAGVDKNGLMFILSNSNPVSLYTINLATGTPTLLSTKTVTGLPSATETVIWGDISVDPTTNRVYCWYHPSPAPVNNLVGLYEINNITGASPSLTKIGIAQPYTVGSLFFNEKGELFGYGSATLGGSQDRIFAINKTTGAISQFGIPDLAVSQTDGCECNFRISLDRQVSVPTVEVAKCGSDSFQYFFTTRNNTSGAVNNLVFADTLDNRLSYTTAAATLQTQLQAIYGATVAVSITDYNAGIKNLVNITGLSVPSGANSFRLTVKVDANRFSGSTVVNQQAYLKGISPVLGGPDEPSNNPNTFTPKDATSISINFNGSKCLPPLANNFINNPIPQGSAATTIPTLIGSDPDGNIASYNILSLPTVAQGVLSIPCPPTPSGATCTGGFANLTAAVLTANPAGISITPAQATALRFAPSITFSGSANFTYNAVDNSSTISNTATYTLPVITMPPVANNIMENSIPNTNLATAIQQLNAADVDGTIVSYQLLSLPTAAQGVLSVPCPPTPAGTICTGGYADITATVLSNYPSGIPLTATQIAGLRFKPTPGFVGNAIFNYNATDNSGNISNTANYTIPVSATVTKARPPLADNIFAQPLNNSLGATTIPRLAANDLDGTIASYTITTVPAAANGILSMSCPATPAGGTCSGGFVNLTAAVLAANPTGIVLTAAQAASIRFDPDPTFIGTASFSYKATDNTSLPSNTATYTIPVVNVAPTSVNINTSVSFASAATVVRPLTGSDADGSILSFTVTSLPTAAQGVISVSCPPTPTGGTCTGGFVNLTPAVLAANPGGIVLTPAQAATLRFDVNDTYSGSLTFNYVCTDNNANVSTPAVYTISINNKAPVAYDITVPVMANTAPATNLTALNATDADGTIVSYTITSLPPTTSGVLSLSGVPVTVNQVLTPAQVSLLQFDPAVNYTGLVGFTYLATDDNGNKSNNANYNIPISGIGNLPPVAHNITTAAIPNTNTATAISALIGSDPDGTVASYTIMSVPPATGGILSVSCPPTPAGATCTGGFADLTQAVVTANPNGIVLTAAQISTLRFAPTASFGGITSFTYFTTDNVGATSNVANYIIPVTGFPPVATPVVAPVIPITNGPTSIPPMIGADIDGSIVSYTIDRLPSAAKGTLSIPCPPTPNGATCTGGFANLTDPVLAANFGGIVLTPAQMNGIRFAPSGLFSGTAIFNYHVTDNAGLTSNTTTYLISISGVSPSSSDVLAPKLLNGSGPSAIPALNSSDADGTITSYVIASVPPASQGVLSIPCPATPTGATCTGGFANLTATVLAANPGGIVLTPAQAAAIRFAPSVAYNGNAVFNYAAYDNAGNLSNVANYTIPVGTLAVLAVSNLKLTAVRSGANIIAKWTSQNESQLSRYELQYSTNATDFVTYGNVTANNMAQNNYTLTMFNFTQSLYYLRLKVFNTDGTWHFSDVVVLRINQAGEVMVYPVPAKTFVHVQFASNAKGNYNIIVMDITGKKVIDVLQKDVLPSQLITLQRAGLANGTYILQLTQVSTGERKISKIIFD